MKKIIIVTLAFGMVACKKEYVTHEPKDAEVVETEKIVEKEVVEQQAFEGRYYFKELGSNVTTGSLEITTDFEGRLDVRQIEKFISKNSNGTFGYHPSISRNDIEVVNGDFMYSKDVNYSSSNDIEEDLNQDNITGKHYTTYKFSVDKDGLLRMTITIYSGSTSSGGSINNVIATRKYKEI